MQKTVTLDSSQPFLLIPSTFEPGGICRFVLTVTSAVDFELKVLGSDGADGSDEDYSERSHSWCPRSPSARDAPSERPWAPPPSPATLLPAPLLRDGGDASSAHSSGRSGRVPALMHAQSSLPTIDASGRASDLEVSELEVSARLSETANPSATACVALPDQAPATTTPPAVAAPIPAPPAVSAPDPSSPRGSPPVRQPSFDFMKRRRANAAQSPEAREAGFASLPAAPSSAPSAAPSVAETAHAPPPREQQSADQYLRSVLSSRPQRSCSTASVGRISETSFSNSPRQRKASVSSEL